MLKRVRRWLYLRVHRRQLQRMIDRDAPAIEIRRKREAIKRAKSSLAAFLILSAIMSACSHVSTSDALMGAALGVQEARGRCERKLAHLDGNESRKAVKARKECLRLPSLELEQDAADTVVAELEETRMWLLVGSPVK